MAQIQILVVEDDIVVAKDIKMHLQDMGYTVISMAATGKEALKQVEKKQPDLVLMDIVLQGEMDGIETADLIRSRFQIPVVYLTAHADRALLERAKLTEPFGYLLKPFNEKELQSTIEMALYKGEIENKLRENREWFSTTLGSIGDAVIATDTKRIITFVNPVAESLTGWKQEEAVGKLLEDVFCIINERTQQTAKSFVARVLQEGCVVGLANHTLLIARDGREIPIDDCCAPIQGKHGVVGAVIVFRDITERKRTEEELVKYRDRLEKLVKKRTAELEKSNRQLQRKIAEHRQAEEALRIKDRAIETSINAVIIACFEEKVNYANHSFREMWGYSKDDVIYGISAISFWENEDDHSNVISALQKDGSWTGEMVAKRKDGSLFDAQLSAHLVKDEKGNPLCMMSSFVDVSEQKRLEAQLRQSQKLQAVGILSGGIAHEFNNILQIIVGYGWRLSTKVYEEEKKFVKEILKAGERGIKLVEQLLDFSKPCEGKLKPLQLALLVKECIEMMRISILPTFEIHESIDSNCGNILANGNQIHQVIVNLMNNAVHAFKDEKGIIKVNLNQVECDEDGKDIPGLKKGTYLKLTVEDNGCGMPSEVKKQIFDPFFTTKEVGKGTGLGLSVVHGLIKAHKGIIKVESEPEQGTTFDIYFPVIEEKYLEEPKPLELLKKGKGHILFVDDEKSINTLFDELLGALGYIVTAIDNSAEALDVFRDNPDTFDLVITDQGMPGMHGIDLAKNILTIRPRIPIVLLTGYGQLINDQKAAEVGIRLYLRKPIAINKLSEILRDILGENHSPNHE